MVRKKNKNKNKILLYSIIGLLLIAAIVIIILTVNNNSQKSETDKSTEKKDEEPSKNTDQVVSTVNVCGNNEYYNYNTNQCENKIAAGSDCKNGVSCESGVCVLGSDGNGTCGGNGLSKNCIEIDTTDNDKCSTCYNLTLNTNKQCCPANCLDCDRDGNCKTCKSGKYLDNNECKTGESRSDLESDITAKNNTITEAKNECNNRSVPHVYSENPFRCLPCTNIPAYIQENVCKNYSDNNTCSNNKWSLWDSSTNEMKCYSEVPVSTNRFSRQKTLKQAIAYCVENETYVHPTYGPVKYWKFPQITNLSYVFDPATYCSGNYSGGCYYVTWTTGASSTRNYRAIQNKVKAWMQKADISGWDVSHVTNMEGMFKNVGSLNNSDLRTKVINIGDRNYMAWDVSNVTNMKYMFNNWAPDNTKIDNWNILTALNTFSHAYAFNGNYNGRGTYSMFPHGSPSKKLISNVPGKAPYWAWVDNSELKETVLNANPAVITMPAIP